MLEIHHCQCTLYFLSKCLPSPNWSNTKMRYGHQQNRRSSRHCWQVSERCLGGHVQCALIIFVNKRSLSRVYGWIHDDKKVIMAFVVERDALQYARVAFNFLFESLVGPWNRSVLDHDEVLPVPIGTIPNYCLRIPIRFQKNHHPAVWRSIEPIGTGFESSSEEGGEIGYW